MKYQARTLMTALMLATSLSLVACASKIEKADIPSSANPQDEIARLETDLRTAQERDVDVLASKDYDRAIKYLEEAKDDVAEREDQEDVLDNLRYSRAYLTAANGTAEYRRSKAPTLLDTRQTAVKAGVARHSELRKDWNDADREVRKNAEDLSKVKVEKLAHLQNQYIDLERRSIILNELGTARAQINGAEKDGAKKKAPQTLKTAQLDFATAEAVISTNARNPENYQNAVMKANQSARMLSDVMATIAASGAKKLPEQTAIDIVMQNREITDLKNDLTSQREQIATAESRARARSQELALANRELASAEHTLALQEALEKARQELGSNEAEAYQQGGSLLIRLKNVKFASGRSDLPQTSLPVLAKVSEVAKGLGSPEIKVEGHTDSTGSEKKNLELSEQRAEAVATYLKTNGFDEDHISVEGYGLSKPVASNKTATGRAQNRRVDIVITPTSTSSESQGTRTE